MTPDHTSLIMFLYPNAKEQVKNGKIWWWHSDVRARKNLHLRAGFSSAIDRWTVGSIFTTCYQAIIRRLNLARDQLMAGESVLMGSRFGSHRDGCCL